MSDPKQVMERHYAAFNAKDRDAFPWSDEIEYVVPGGEVLRGKEEALGFIGGFWEAFPDARQEIAAMVAEGSRVMVEGKLVATHSGVFRTPDGEVPPTERRIELGWMAMFEIRGDELVSERLYFDQLELLAQLGLAPTPG